jgi:hypothetical protein
VHFIKNGKQLISNVVKFGEGYTLNNSIERHALAFFYEEIPNTLHSPVLGLSQWKRGHNARCLVYKWQAIHEQTAECRLLYYGHSLVSSALTCSSTMSSFILANESKITPGAS